MNCTKIKSDMSAKVRFIPRNSCVVLHRHLLWDFLNATCKIQENDNLFETITLLRFVHTERRQRQRHRCCPMGCLVCNEGVHTGGGRQRQRQWHRHGMGWIPICDGNGNGKGKLGGCRHIYV